jgi:hypothetical protein
MSEKEIKRRWANWVVNGEGRDRSPISDGGYGLERYGYRDKVLYSHQWPVARLVQSPNGWVCLSKTGVRPDVRLLAAGTRNVGSTFIAVPCVGVYTHLDGDMIDDDKLHERIRWLCHLSAQDVIEKAHTWPGAKLFLGGGDKELIGSMGQTSELYDTYDRTFKLGWAAFRDYAGELDAVLAKRKDGYYSDAEVAKRVRAQARKEAKLALGIDK